MSSQKPFLLYTWRTPNGLKVTVLLEELKAVYGESVDYEIHPIDISTNIQKEPWFIKLNPNGRIPVLVDRNRDNFVVFETGAILLYLVQHYDKEKKFSYAADTNEHSEILQWMFFAHGGVGPMQGQANFFSRYATEKIPYAINRYINETKRLYGVLNIRLDGRDWLAGPGKGTFSVADMNVLPWVHIHDYTGIPTLEEFPNLKSWVERSKARPATLKGLEIGK